jgi:hypothetical protein
MVKTTPSAADEAPGRRRVRKDKKRQTVKSNLSFKFMDKTPPKYRHPPER